ncbi:MAG: hypothetical protein JSS99_18085 [Actinobacteria bacterium]|nr:hypothetical protein [Actinomycetota bacterium]
MYRKVAAALVAVLALGLASCGGSEPELTRAQLVRKVELACREAQAIAAREARAKGRAGENGAFIAGLLGGQKAVLDRIHNLNAPNSIQSEFDALKQGMQDRIDAVERVASASRADMQRMIRAVQPQAEAAARRMEAASNSLGIRGCV